MLSNWVQWSEIISNIVTALAAGIAALVAVPGINAWRRQLKGETGYELARRYLRAVYRVRDAIKIVRSPLITVGEMAEALEKQGYSAEDINDHQKKNRAVYATRWEKVSEALSDLELELREAEVLWGKDAVNVERDFDSKVRKLSSQIYLFLNGHSTAPIDEIIYDTGDTNPFTLEVEESIKPIADFLKPHLK